MTERIGGHGGKREGAGRKPASERTASEDLEAYNKAKARVEEAKAEDAEFNLAIKKREYVLRSAVQTASATAVAAIVQSLRSLPDNLERKFNLKPEVVESIAKQVDEALAELGRQFKAMAGE